MSSLVKKIVFHNASYKVVSLFVAVVLWVTLIGRRDFQISHDLTLQVLLAPNHYLVNKPPKTIKVKLSGPRANLKKIVQDNEILSLDLTKLRTGRQIITVSSESLALPVGVKVISLEPDKLNIYIKKTKDQIDGN